MEKTLAPLVIEHQDFPERSPEATEPLISIVIEPPLSVLVQLKVPAFVRAEASMTPEVYVPEE
jgi:hypothetical protein